MITPTDALEGRRTMLVTGASRGIGAAIALKAAAAGYRVALNYHRSQREAETLADGIRNAGGEALVLQADVGSQREVQRMFERLDEGFGSLDVLVNNAGVLARFSVADATEEQVEAVFRGNVFSLYFCSREAVRRMSTKHGGRGGAILNMSSVASRLGGLGGGAAYAASKGAVDTFTLSLAKEVGAEGIRVNALRPGLIETEIHDVHGGMAQMQALARDVVPMGRSGSAGEVADVALWVVSAAASYVHGAVIDVAGGR
jgi:NAD(P)-dependent dehydrogenase (short-subunit alcohol dehydrogenase family)